ncbi:MAG: hypothetical protein RLZZ219_1573 [Cyanobacteriota bacterium]|jgi:hypothetical protein
MGFDPRRWSADPSPSRRVSANLDALLEENLALRRELQRLRSRLDQLERQSRAGIGRSWREPPAASADPPPPPAQPRVTAAQVQRWGESLARQSGWRDLRLGRESEGLRGLILDLNRRSLHPQLSLEQRLDRLAPGLGHDLQAALAGPPTRWRFAVLAAFALYGVSALEWLEDDPRRVVADLRLQLQRLERGGGPGGRSRRTRSDRRSTDRGGDRAAEGGAERQASRDAGQGGAAGGRAAEAAADPRRAEAYRVLGLAWGASRQAIKAAHRRLVKQHHPDLGGRPEDFHRVNEAYQRLLA